MTPLDHRAVTMPDIHPLRASRAARTVEIVDQTLLPGEWKIVSMTNVSEAAHAIRTMQVRGAPLIGATAAYGLALAMHADPSDIALRRAHSLLFDTRPTAVNLRWALDRVTAVERSRFDRRRRRANEPRHRPPWRSAHRAARG
jgi:methylthioribose-1-phosphate isomerase